MLLHFAIAWLVLTFTTPRPVHALPPSYFVPAMQTIDEASYLGPDSFSPVTYPDQLSSAQSTPLIPLLPWGLRFTADYLVSLENDSPWAMIEIVRVDTPKGGTWFVLDSHLDGTQVVGLPSSDPAAASLASLFPAPFYDAGLVVKRTPATDGNEKIEASYRRQDGSRVAFEMTVDPAKKDQLFRNGNGMNHSERSALAVIDLESFQFASDFHFTDGSARRAQSLAGFGVAGLLVQTAAGLMSGHATQTGVALSRAPATPGMSPLPARLESHAAPESNSLTLVEKNLLQTTEYDFDLRGKARQFAELRSVRIQQAQSDGSNAPVLTLRFNPSLPDFRYALEIPRGRMESRVTFAVAGQPAYASAVFSIEPGDRVGQFRLGVRGEYPSWVHERPLRMVLDTRAGQGATLAARVLTPEGEPLSLSTVDAGTPASSIDALQAFSFAWEKRPHRLSALRVRLPGTLSPSDPGIGQLGGGTWANGSSASDTAYAKVSTVSLEGADFYSVSTPELPLLQKVHGYDEAKVEATHRLDIRFPQGRLNGIRNPAVFVNGFEFRAGPAHEQTGLTFAGSAFDITNWTIRDPQTLSVEVVLRQRFASVPDRVQDFMNYSGLGRLHLVVALPKRGSGKDFDGIQKFPDHREKDAVGQVLPEDPIVPECLDTKSLEPRVFTAMDFSVLDTSFFPGRYIRKIQASTAPAGDFELFLNDGELSRDTHYGVDRTVLGVAEALTSPAQSGRCFAPPSQ